VTQRRVDARDVLDPNARTKAVFRGRIIGHYRRAGPNAWDDYEFVEANGGSMEVMAGLKVQAEPPLARLRLRRRGRVFVVEWSPTPEDEAERARAQQSAFEFFAERHLAEYSSPPGWGLAAVVYKKLKDDDRDIG
jgi:hypothetical protein